MHWRYSGLIVAALAGLASWMAFDRLPPHVATLWTLRGEPAGYSSRITVAAFGPILIVAITVLRQVLPRIFNVLLNVVALFAFVLHVAVLGNGAGVPVNVVKVTGTAFGVMFIVLGVYCVRLKRGVDEKGSQGEREKA